MGRQTLHATPWVVSAAWLGGLALFVGLIAMHRPGTVCVHDAAASPAGMENMAEIQAELAAWEELWDELEAEGVDALAPEARVAGARYAGDTCGMRYRRLYRGVDRETRERFVIAAFANEPETKRELLQPLLDSPDDQIRARAATELTRVALRQGDTAAAESALSQGQGLDLPAACEADRRYLEGRIAVHRGQAAVALEAFEAATALDPGYWNAYRDRLPVLVRALHGPDLDVSTCLRHARTLIEVLGLLPQLADDTRQFAKLALSLERLGARSSATLLASGLTWRWAGQATYGRGVLTRGLQAPELLPAPCEREMRARIAIELEGS